jgi:predicted nucleic acid-binding protein
MSATDAFLDSNTLLYLMSPAVDKAARSEALLIAGGTISVQVLNECALAASRKFHAPWPAILDFLGVLRTTLEVKAVTIDTHELGLRVAERYRFRIYDSMLLAAALLADCTTFYSEDLHAGQVIENTLTIRNPFLPT